MFILACEENRGRTSHFRDTRITTSCKKKKITLSDFVKVTRPNSTRFCTSPIRFEKRKIIDVQCVFRMDNQIPLSTTRCNALLPINLGLTWFSCSLYPFTPNRQNIYLVHWNICAWILQRTPLLMSCSKTRWRKHCLHVLIFFLSLDRSDNNSNLETWKKPTLFAKEIETTCILLLFFLLLGNRVAF